MEYRKIKGIDKELSRFIIGTGDLFDVPDLTDDFNRLDAALELGITTIDTAMGYGHGTAELALGKYFKSRGNRKEFFIIDKCCHPSPWRTRFNTYDMEADLNDAFVKLGTDYIDLYCLHRDDESKPVEPIMDTLFKYYKTGQIKGYGVSNWSIPRIEAANKYARECGMPEFFASSPNYSLAYQYQGPWAPVVVTITGDENEEARKWYTDTQMPVLCYSSLGRGMYSGKITREMWKNEPDKIEPALLRGYCIDENFDRLDRCKELAKIKDCEVPQIALAFVLGSSMNTFPILGAKNKEEIISSLGAANVTLTQEERDFIDLKKDSL